MSKCENCQATENVSFHPKADVDLCLGCAQALAAENDKCYYRGLLDEIAVVFGEDSYIADDGSRMQDPLRAKMPELVRAQAAKLAALSAPDQEGEAKGWQPIETAPKDGTLCLGWHPDYKTAFIFNFKGGVFKVTVTTEVIPTHWQPLPTPPKEA